MTGHTNHIYMGYLASLRCHDGPTGVYEQTAQTQDLHYLPYHPHFLTYILGSNHHNGPTY